jgi:hypothetical protein
VSPLEGTGSGRYSFCTAVAVRDAFAALPVKGTLMRSSRFCSLTGVLSYTALATACAVSCVTEDVDPLPAAGGSAGTEITAGSSGAAGAPTTTGGSGGTGTSGSGGSGGIQNDPAFGVATECRPIGQALISDFTPPVPALDAGVADASVAAPVANITFGDFTNTLSGGTYEYPNAVGDPYIVNSDMSQGEWHMSGNIGNYSGFGLYLTGCNRFDASAYAGISFSIRGNVAMMGSLSLQVGTSADDISHLYLNSQPTPPSPLAEPNSGRCIPAANQYDGSCATPTFTVPVTATETTIEVRWTDLTGGVPSASVNPAEITSIRWIFPNPVGVGTATPTTYAVDLFVDDLSFIPNP